MINSRFGAMLGSFLSLSATFANSAHAAEDIVTIPVGQTAEIDRHGICRKVTNRLTHPVAIPTRTAEEWGAGPNSFLGRGQDIVGMLLEQCLGFTIGKQKWVQCYTSSKFLNPTSDRRWTACSMPRWKPNHLKTDEQAFGFDLATRPDRVDLLGYDNVRYTQTVPHQLSSCIVGFKPLAQGMPPGWPWRVFEPGALGAELEPTEAQWVNMVANSYEVSLSGQPSSYSTSIHGGRETSDDRNGYQMPPPPQDPDTKIGWSRANSMNYGSNALSRFRWMECAPPSVDLPPARDIVTRTVSQYERFYRTGPIPIVGLSGTIPLNIIPVLSNPNYMIMTSGYGLGASPGVPAFKADPVYYRINGSEWRRPNDDAGVPELMVKTGDVLELSIRIPWPSSTDVRSSESYSVFSPEKIAAAGAHLDFGGGDESQGFSERWTYRMRMNCMMKACGDKHEVVGPHFDARWGYGHGGAGIVIPWNQYAARRPNPAP